MKEKKKLQAMSTAGVHKRFVLFFLHSVRKPTPLRSFTLLSYHSSSSSSSPPLRRHQQQSLREAPPSPPTTSRATLADFVRRSLDLAPETMRRFWRATALGPDDFHQIVLGFTRADEGSGDCATRKARLLWDLLQWAADEARHPHFHLQLPAPCKRTLASLLVRARMFPEAEFLISVPSRPEAGAVPLEGGGAYAFGDVYSDVIGGYVADGDIDRSMSLYHRARARGISPSASCFEQLLRLIVESEGDAHRHSFLAVYSDMVELELAKDDGDHLLRFAVRVLCRDRKILEAVALIRRVSKSCGMLRNPVPVVDLIANAYCNQRDFDALIVFLEDLRCTPSPVLCNKIMSSICEHSGANMAWIILQKLEVLGFRPDSRTFAIFICWSCKQKKLRDAFIFLSELLSRNLKPDVHAYNPLISGLFREGLWKYAHEVFTDMSVGGVTPEMSTFRVLLAGYCRERKFDEARMILQEMVDCGMTTLAPWEDSLSKVFTLLGFGSLHVKIKRINDMKLQKAEFYDSIGNGLFLHTDDTDEYDKSLAGILENGLIPDFDLSLLEECHMGNIRKMIGKKEEALQYAQKLSLQTYSTLLGVLSSSSYDTKVISDLFEEMQEFFDELDHQTLNLLVQMLSKKGLLLKAGLVLDELFQRKLPIENKTFTSLIVSSCRGSNQKRFKEYWEVAQRSGWLPGINDFNVFVSYLCKYGMLKEVLDLFWGMTEKYPHAVTAVRAAFLNELCISLSFGIENTPNGQSAKNGRSLDYKVYENLKKDLCKEVKLSEALEVLDLLLSENIPVTPAVCQLLMPFIIGPENLDKTMVLKRVFLGSQSQVSLSVCKVFVSELCKVGNLNEANHLLLEMTMAGLSPDGDILNLIVDGYAKESNSIRAYESLCFMLKMDMDLSLSTYRSLIRLNIVQNRLLHCLNLIKMFIKDGDSRSITFYNILIFYLFQARKAQVVEIILDEMQMKQLILDHVSYNFLVFGYYVCGNTKKSIESIKFMLSKDLMPSSRSFRIAIDLCVHFSPNEASDLRKVMYGWGIKHGSIVQNALIDKLFSQGNLEEACRLLDQLEENDLVPNNICYDNLIRKFCEHQMVDKAIDLLNLMLKKGNVPSETTYSSIVVGLLVQKKFDLALDFHAEMQNKNFHLSVETCIALVNGLCGSGRTDDASMLLETTVHSGLLLPSNIIYLVINRYNAENNLHKAMDLLHKMQQSGYLPDFETHWSLVSSLSDTSNKHTKRKEGFLSNILSQSGTRFRNHNVKSTGSKKYCHRKK